MNDVLNVSSNQEISQPGDVTNTCFCRPSDGSTDNSADVKCISKLTESDEKKSTSLPEIMDKIKVINLIFLSAILMFK